MKLLVKIEAPDWKTAPGSNQEERNRKFAFASALRDIATTMENCGTEQGSIDRGALTGSFKIINQPAEH